MNKTDILWDETARNKILTDADHVLQDAVLDLAGSMSGGDADEIYDKLNAQLTDKFIDYVPGPDARKYAEAIAAGEVDTAA